MYLLNTNHCSFSIEGEPNVVNRFRSIGEVIVTTSVITSGKLRYMAQNYQQKAANLIKVRVFLRRINVIPIDDEIAEIYGDFKSELIKEFRPKEKSQRKTTKFSQIGIGENDLWIAATAIRHSLTIVSCDSDFERMREIRSFPLESWV